MVHSFNDGLSLPSCFTDFNLSASLPSSQEQSTWKWADRVNYWHLLLCLLQGETRTWVTLRFWSLCSYNILLRGSLRLGRLV